MSYTEIMKHDLLCNYVDIQKRNASDIILPCINQPNQIKKTEPDIAEGIINTVRPIPKNTRELIEGFTSDMNIHGGGVENKRQGNNDPRGNKFCRNGQGCDYSHASKVFYFNPGTDGAKPYQYCPEGSEFLGVNQKGEIVCSK